MEPSAHFTERERLSALRRARVLDTPSEDRFDRITRLAARLLGAPLSLLTFVEEDRVWNKSCFGTDMRELAPHHSVCAHAIHEQKLFVIEDLRDHDTFASFPHVAGEPNVRFYAGAPVRSADGHVLGMLCVADTRPRTLSREEGEALEDLAEMAALEVARLQHRADELLEVQNRLLEMVAQGRPLSETLTVLCRAIENVSGGMTASVLLLDPDEVTLRHGAAPSLPERYTSAIDGAKIGPGVGSCGTAAYTREAVYVADLSTDPLWKDYRDLALPHGLRACWSTPIFSSEGPVLGTFALYYHEPRSASRQERDVISVATHVAGIAIERHRSAERLREQEGSFRLLAENAQDVIVRLGPDLSIVYASPSLERLLGYTLEAVRGTSLLGLIHAEDALPVEAARQAVLGGRPVTVTTRIRHRDGHYVWVEATANAPADPDSGEVREIHVVARDITDRKRAEADAEQADARFRTLVEQSITGVYIVQDGRFVYVNPRFAEMTGYTLDELLSMSSIAAVIHPDDRAMVADNIRRRIQGEAVQARYGIRGVRKNGEGIFTEVHGTVIEYQGKPALLGTILDTTERTLAEQALRASREQYRAVLQDVQDAIFETDASGRWSFLSPAWERITGIPVSDVVGTSFLDFIHPEHRAEIKASFTEVMMEQAESCCHEVRRIARCGEARWIEVRATAFRGLSGQPDGVRGIIRDIHEQVESRRERDRLALQLEAERSRLAYIFEHAPAAICTTRGPDHVFEMANENYLRFVGYRDVIGKSVLEALPEMAGQAIMERLDEVLRTGVPFHGTEVPIWVQQAPDAAPELRYANFVYGPLREADGSVSGVFTHGFDVTEHVLARERIAQTSRANALIMDHSPDVICTVDREGRFVQVSAASTKVWGYTPEELVGRNDRLLVHPEDIAKTDAAARETYDGKQFTSFENRLVRKDGSIVHLTWSAGWSEADGLMFCIARDVTGQRKAEAARRESEERLRLATEAADIGVFDVDLVARTTTWSDKARAHFGLAPEVPVTRELFLSLMHPGELEQVRRMQAESMDPRGDGRFHLEHRVCRPDGEVRWIETSGEVAFAGEGEDRQPVRMIGTYVDVTERHRAQAELVRAKDRAEEMHRLKSSFLANMSHEIRTPLASIIGFSEILADEIEGEGREFVDLISKSGKRLLETLNSVLDLAQLESGGMQLRLEPVDVTDEIRSVVAMFTPQAAGKGLRLRFEPSEELPAILVDRPAFGRVLSNLVSNAIKFTRAGGVTVSSRRAGGLIEISVADTGVGISPSFLPHVFDEFRQESSGTTRNFEGSGLGLTITRRLVELMGGKIALSSEQGRGTVFTVTLEGASAPAAPLRVEKTEAENTAPRRRAILAVEDTPETQTLLRHILSATFDVDLASSTEEALEMARRRTYAAFIIDINLGPGKDGVELLRELRQMEAYATTFAVACTAYAMPGDEQVFRTTGFDAYLSKPFRRQDLLRILQDVQ